jgi:hypothetical protein
MTTLPTIDHLRSKAKEYGTEPYWFGLGFIQLKLNDTVRMHFWLPEIPHPEREEIHNHRYDFTSTVLAGHLMHEVWHLNSLITANALRAFTEWEIFETNCAPNKEGTVETVTPCTVSKVGEFSLAAGSIYAFPHTSFHTTEGTKFAITHLTRVLPKTLEFASVIKKRGTATVCPFAEKLPTDLCWQYIEAALRKGRE